MICEPLFNHYIDFWTLEELKNLHSFTQVFDKDIELSDQLFYWNYSLHKHK